MTVISFLFDYQSIFIFYIILIIFFYIRRKHLVIQSKIIILYRTVFGLSFIEKISQKYKEWVKLWGYIGIGIGFSSLAVISFSLITLFVQLFTRPNQPSGVQLVIPGATIPGLGALSFWDWFLAIFIIALVHEFAHGIVARAHGIPVKWTGIVLLGPILGAFVEPDEKKLPRTSDTIQYSVYAAGSFANICLAIIAFLLLIYVALPVQHLLAEPVGITFGTASASSPAVQVGLLPSQIITQVNGTTIHNSLQFMQEISRFRPHEMISLTVSQETSHIRSGFLPPRSAPLLQQSIQFIDSPIDKVKTIQFPLAEHPNNNRRPFIGINNVTDVYLLKNPLSASLRIFDNALLDIIDFLRWLTFLSFSIGLFNMLPLPIVDGGRMAHTFFVRLFGEKKGKHVYGRVGMFFLAILIIILGASLVRWVF